MIMLEVLLVLFGVEVAWVMVGWTAHRAEAGLLRRALVLAMLAIAVSLPLLLWNHSAWARGLSTLPMFLLIAKTWEVGRRNYTDDQQFDAFVQFVVWAWAPPEGRWYLDPEKRRQCRKKAGPRARRFALKLIAFAALLAVNQWWSFQHIRTAQLVWASFVIYVFFSGFRDALAAAYSALGAEVIQMFDAPPLARNPRDFWGRRWNLWFTRLSHRLIFQPLGGKQRPVLAGSAVFLASAFLHEVIASVGLLRVDGRMTVFFVVHGLGTMAFTKMAHRWPVQLPRVLAIALHFAWLTATVPWFFDPINEFIFLSEWTLQSALDFISLSVLGH